ncbi:MAG TPA: hypothetical protein VK929_00190 [Longimicrobiales bacterium]|nr:hypothetical protein [Longimicrobiales bacterium]
MLRPLSVLAAVVAGLLWASPALAQELVVRGQVFGPDATPMAEQRVVLHRVNAEGGATIAETVSGADGRFELLAEAEADTAAVLFVAARYDGELYIGPPFRAGDEAAVDQLIQVGLPELSASAMMADDGGFAMPMPRRQDQTRTWVLILIPLLGVAGVVIYALIPKGRIPGDRARLIRIAELDERMDTAPDAQRASMLEERQRLVAELRQG